jgi:ribonuclease MRP protein subunit RMP1
MMEIEVVQLQAVSRILQSIHHRNKNQHGQSTWWKWLAMLKRCVGNLVKELERKDSKRTRARMEYMRENLLPKCYV